MTADSLIVEAAKPGDEFPLVNSSLFYPDIDPEEVRQTMRLDGTVTKARLREEVVSAMIQVNRELYAWKVAQMDARYESLAEVPDYSSEVGITGTVADKVSLYKRAVALRAAWQLNEKYRNFDSTAEGQRRAAEQQPVIDDLARNYRWTINEIMDLAHCDVELL